MWAIQYTDHNETVRHADVADSVTCGQVAYALAFAGYAPVTMWRTDYAERWLYVMDAYGRTTIPDDEPDASAEHHYCASV